MFTQFIDFLKGKKSYFVGTLAIGLGLYLGDREMITTGLGIITLRAGIAKLQ